VLLSPPRRKLAELLAAMPDIGFDADFQRQEQARHRRGQQHRRQLS
jgi:hypothetical protein